MTRGRTAPQKAADVAAHKGRAALIEMAFDSGTLRLAIAPFNITVGADVFVATGAAFEMTAVEETAAGFEGFEVSLSGVDSAIEAIMASEQYRGRIIRVLEQRFDANDAKVGAAQVQSIGRMRAMGHTDNVKDQSARVWLQAEHFDAEFEQPMVIRFTDADQQRKYPGDVGGEFLASLQDRVITRASKS